MAVIKQGGRASLPPGTQMTTMGPRQGRAQRCQKCGEKRDGNYTINANGQIVCSECMSPKERLVINSCDPDNCACESKVERVEPDPA